MLVALWAVPAVEAQAYNWKNVPIHGGGFVSGLEFHPTEPGLLYARTDVGGAFRYDTANSRWIPLNDATVGTDNAFMELGVASLALDPQDPNRLYLACGQYVASWAPAATLMRSTDRGATWTRTTPAFKLTPAPPAQYGGFRGISVSAQNPAVIAVSTLNRWWPAPGDEIYRSTDGGAIWSSRLHSGTRDDSSAPWAAPINPHWIGDVEIDPTNPDRALFVTGFGFYQTNNFAATAPTCAFLADGQHVSLTEKYNGKIALALKIR